MAKLVAPASVFPSADVCAASSWSSSCELRCARAAPPSRHTKDKARKTSELVMYAKPKGMRASPLNCATPEDSWEKQELRACGHASNTCAASNRRHRCMDPKNFRVKAADVNREYTVAGPNNDMQPAVAFTSTSCRPHSNEYDASTLGSKAILRANICWAEWVSLFLADDASSGVPGTGSDDTCSPSVPSLVADSCSRRIEHSARTSLTLSAAKANRVSCNTVDQ
eukprot:scaffold1381_cov386-Prasinococcus_capsulatus_cf.AAC.7